LTADIIALATQYGRYGYCRITALLQQTVRLVGIKRVHRIWRREGLKVPHSNPSSGGSGSPPPPAAFSPRRWLTTSQRKTPNPKMS